jgi:hypothetical protein
MRSLSVLAFILGLSFFANALAGQWAFDFSKTSGKYVVFDVLLGLACWAASAVLWRVHVVRSLRAGRDPLV